MLANIIENVPDAMAIIDVAASGRGHQPVVLVPVVAEPPPASPTASTIA